MKHLALATVVLAGCAPTAKPVAQVSQSKAPVSRAVSQNAVKVPDGYRCAPNKMQGWLVPWLALDGEAILIARSDGAYRIAIPESDFSAPSIREIKIDLYHSMFSWVKSNKDGDIALGELDGSGDVRTFIYEGGRVSQILPELTDTSNAEFSQDGKVLTQISYNRLMVSNLATRKSRTVKFGKDWSWDMSFVPGSFGRLVLVEPTAEGSGKPVSAPYWVDSALGRRLTSKELKPPGPGHGYFVDQGVLLSDDGKKVISHGRYTQVSQVLARKDSSSFSPWHVARATDRKSVTVRSIYRSGPVYKLSGKIFGQDLFAFGAHALVTMIANEDSEPDRIEIVDLRDGKVGATIWLRETEWLIQVRSGHAVGSEKMLASLKLSGPKVNVTEVRKVLFDLLAAP